MTRTLESVAHAKLNLTLRIVGRRADGLHLLDGLTAFTEFGDLVRLSDDRDVDSIYLSGPFASRVEGENIVSKALDRYRAATGFSPGLAIEIEKNIPVAAGLGGGSCDAAAVLRMLQELADNPLGPGELAALAVSVGADVPVCLGSRSARMRGIGERLTPLQTLPTCQVLLVNPGVELSAGQVFKDFHGPYSAPAGIPVGYVDETGLFSMIGAEAPNDLLRPAVTSAPEVAEVLTYLGSLPNVRSVGMSGSGATCFGLFASDTSPNLNGGVDGAREKGWWATATSLRG